ncbi:MAG: DUF86 domain-containing protein [Chlamydiae bacterium]|nr:DUF86 domain-containing protein [Chlamydiota bacterium]MBI3277521.1 DUF86 domain-containing protein [Chlamydiota bacterium]
MTPLPLEKESLLVRVNGIQGELSELGKLSVIPFKIFSEGDPFKLAQYYLHRALEGIFNISSHILSRLPGGYKGGTYKEMARLLGEKGIVSPEFAKGNLTKIAGYRNRLVHFYAEIMPEELYDILHHHLTDIEIFLKAVKDLMEKPERFGLSFR